MPAINKFVTGVALATAVVASCALSLSAPADASEVVYGAPGTPNQYWTGSLGLDFIVDTPIVVSALGVYSADQPGTYIDVEIFTGSGTPVPGLSADILTTSSLYTFQSVTPVILAPGTYQVTAWGYGPIDNYNTGISPGTPITFNTLGGALTLGSPYYNSPGVFGFATILDNFNAGYDNNQPHYYGAGNLVASATPLPSTWTMLIAGFAGLGFFAYRGSKKGSAVLTAA
jgi:hypothetical protein